MMRPGLRQSVPAVTALGVAVALALETPTTGLAAAAPVLVVGTEDRFGLWSQVRWILGAATLGGALGYGTATLAAPAVTTVALGFGIAVGGGLGAVVRLLVFGDPDVRDPEEVTVSSARDGTSPPDPQPIDLFEDHPDPILYFDDSGGGPVVRVANRAFEETFGVGSGAVENAALADALMVTDRSGAVVAAASDGASFEAVIDCETAGEDRPFRVRTIAVAHSSATRGYVIYTPVEDDG